MSYRQNGSEYLTKTKKGKATSTTSNSYYYYLHHLQLHFTLSANQRAPIIYEKHKK